MWQLRQMPRRSGVGSCCWMNLPKVVRMIGSAACDGPLLVLGATGLSPSPDGLDPGHRESTTFCHHWEFGSDSGGVNPRSVVALVVAFWIWPLSVHHALVTMRVPSGSASCRPSARRILQGGARSNPDVSGVSACPTRYMTWGWLKASSSKSRVGAFPARIGTATVVAVPFFGLNYARCSAWLCSSTRASLLSGLQLRSPLCPRARCCP